jgi:hypothetical protein
MGQASNLCPHLGPSQLGLPGAFTEPANLKTFCKYQWGLWPCTDIMGCFGKIPWSQAMICHMQVHVCICAR